MARKNKQTYITVPYEGVKPEWVQKVSTEELLASSGIKVAGLGTAEVSYRIENIADAQKARCTSEGMPRILLVSRNQAAIRPITLLARDNKLSLRYAYVGDSPKLLHEWAVCLLSDEAEDAFDNSYAVLEAAQRCEATAILLVDSTLETDEVFLGVAASLGMHVYRCLRTDATFNTWVACESIEINDDATWTKCSTCELLFDDVSWAKNYQKCPSCGSYRRMSSEQRIDGLVDLGSFAEWDCAQEIADPLEFSGYKEKIEALREKTGLDEAVRCGKATIAGIEVALCVMESQFMMGSMGSVVGEKITRAVERATRESLPLIIISASGGARMQEGLMSLMQMAKISCVLANHGDAGNLFLSVLTDPTTGGVTASFAMQGDIIFAEPKTLIGFAGKRVIKNTINQDLPEGFQTAEFALEHGLIDAIVAREEMRDVLAHTLALHKASSNSPYLITGDKITYATMCENVNNRSGRFRTAISAVPPSMQRVLETVAEKVHPSGPAALVSNLFGRRKQKEKQIRAERQLGSLLYGEGADVASKKTKASGVKSCDEKSNPAWESVKLARNQNRPTARYYLNALVDGFIELHGDRAGADDQSILCGIGWIGSQPVTIVAQEKGSNLKDRLKCNFGCTQPWGYRKSLRIMKQAAKFGRPVVCLVDTPGAHPGLEAEEQGQGNAIAENLLGLAGLSTPVISVILSEGGSGGALALALGDRVVMLENAMYSILSPEGFASILWKDKDRAPEAAAAMKISAKEACEMGVVDEVISEGDRPAHENPEVAATRIRSYLVRTLDELSVIEPYHLVEQRKRRFRKF